MTVTFDIPDAIARELGGSPDAIARELLEDAAAEGYRLGKFSHFQVRTILGLSSWTETEQFLRSRNIPPNYGEADLEQDPSKRPRALESQSEPGCFRRESASLFDPDRRRGCAAAAFR